MSTVNDNAMSEEDLNLLAMNIDRNIPEDMGFFLLMAPSGDGKGRRTQYVSNMDRADSIKVMKEWLIKGSHEEDWMKHIT